jgi:CRISPR-associated endonuclease/helicase Cas3
LEKMLPPEVEAPVLLPAHLDFWVQTRPVPDPDPEVSLWLHGPDRGEPEVQVVWRSDLSEQAFQEARVGGDKREALLDRIEACPPTSPEALSLPVSAARRWLEGAKGREEVADVEGGRAPEEDDERERRGSMARLALKWAGEESRPVRPDEISGGDTLVVPSGYGGLSAGNWTPGASDPVADLGERAHAIARGKAVLRLVLPPPAPVDEWTPEQKREAIGGWIEALLDAAPGDWRTVLLKHFQRGLEPGACRIERLPALSGEVGPAFALFGKRPLTASELEALRGRAAEAGPVTTVTTEDDSASFSGVNVRLRTHLAGVEELARDFATRAQLPADRVADLALAGAWHDAGKVDPRFQVMLHGGSRFLAEVAEEPLAKSSMPANDRIARQAAQRASGYPRGARHELASVALMLASRRIREGAKDLDLVLHLVASHHGWCRPLAPVVAEPSPVEMAFEKDGERLVVSSATQLERLDSGVSERFWALVRRYGWFGLAWMEAILRLADHRRSELEQRGGEHA